MLYVVVSLVSRMIAVAEALELDEVCGEMRLLCLDPTGGELLPYYQVLFLYLLLYYCFGFLL